MGGCSIRYIYIMMLNVKHKTIYHFHTVLLKYFLYEVAVNLYTDRSGRFVLSDLSVTRSRDKLDLSVWLVCHTNPF